MRISQLLILLLSSKKPIIASARLVERQGLNVLPELDPLGAVVGGVELLQGIGNAIGSGAANLFTNPQNSDSSKTEPQPATDTPSDGKTSPNPPAEPYYKTKIDDPNLFSGSGDAIKPAQNLFLNPLDSDSLKTEPHPAADTTSDGKTAPISPLLAPNPPAEPVYKIKIDNSGGPGSSPVPETKPNRPAILPAVNEECDASPPDLSFLQPLSQRMTLALALILIKTLIGQRSGLWQAHGSNGFHHWLCYYESISSRLG